MKKNKWILMLFLILVLLTNNSKVKATSSNESNKEDDTKQNKKKNKNAKDMKVKKNNKLSKSIVESDLEIDGVKIKKKQIKDKHLSNENYTLDITPEEAEAIILYNKDASNTGVEQIPISVESPTVEEAQLETGGVLVKMIDGVLSTKDISAAMTIKKVNFWGAGYEMYIAPDGTILYCVHYGPMATSKYSQYNNFESFLRNRMKWSDSTIQKRSHIALWGTRYTKVASPDNYGYAASAQSLIWNGAYHPGATTAKKNTIMNRVNAHLTNVSFHKKAYTIKADGKPVTITDSKKELGNWFTVDAVAFTKATGIKVVKSGNSIILTNPVGNTKTAKSIVKLEKYKGMFKTGKGYGLYAGNAQELVDFTYNDPLVSYITVQPTALEYGKLSLHKDMDDEDLYGKLIKDSSDMPIYLTADGNNVTTEGIVIDMFKMPSKTDMIANDLFEKPMSYQYPVLIHKKVLQDKYENGSPVYILDGNGDKMPQLDTDGNPMIDINGDPLYLIVQEEVNAKDLNGNDVFIPKLDGSNNIIYATRTLAELYPTQKVADNIYDGDSIKFDVKNSAGVSVDTLTTDVNGNATSDNLPIGKYTVKETVTKSGFILRTNTYTINITKDTIAKVNNGASIINYKALANLKIKKVDKVTNTPLSNVKFALYESVANTCALENLTEDKIIWSGITDENGEIDYDTGTARTICVKELETKNGYLLNETIHTVNLVLNQTANILQENKAIKLNLNIKKLGYEDVILPGTMFDLHVYDAEDNTVHEMKDLVIDENGFINLSFDSNKKFFDDAGNSYRFVLTETKALDDYVLLEPIQFYVAMNADKKLELSKDEFQFEKDLTGDEIQNVELIVNNVLEHADLVLIKKAKDTKNKQVATYRFDFYNQEGTIYETKEIKSTLGNPPSIPVYFKLTSKVCATEVKAPNNYILDPTTKCLETKNFKHGDVMKYEFFNERIITANTGFSIAGLFN